MKTTHDLLFEAAKIGHLKSIAIFLQKAVGRGAALSETRNKANLE